MEMIGLTVLVLSLVLYLVVKAPPLTGAVPGEPLDPAPPVPPATPLTIPQIIEAAAAKWGQDAALMRALAMKESSNNPKAINASDPSYGLFQIMEFWLPEFGYPQKKELLLDPVIASDVAAQILKYFQARINPQTRGRYRFPQEIDVFNVGETKWAKGIRSPAYRDDVTRLYRNFGGTK